MAGVPYVDSAGIGALVGAYVNHQKDGRSLVLRVTAPRAKTNARVSPTEAVSYLLLQVHYYGQSGWIALYPCGTLTSNTANLEMVREAANKPD